jgi:hypothetical protein
MVHNTLSQTLNGADTKESNVHKRNRTGATSIAELSGQCVPSFAAIEFCTPIVMTYLDAASLFRFAATNMSVHEYLEQEVARRRDLILELEREAHGLIGEPIDSPPKLMTMALYTAVQTLRGQALELISGSARTSIFCNEWQKVQPPQLPQGGERQDLFPLWLLPILYYVPPSTGVSRTPTFREIEAVREMFGSIRAADRYFAMEGITFGLAINFAANSPQLMEAFRLLARREALCAGRTSECIDDFLELADARISRPRKASTRK